MSHTQYIYTKIIASIIALWCVMYMMRGQHNNIQSWYVLVIDMTQSMSQTDVSDDVGRPMTRFALAQQYMTQLIHQYNIPFGLAIWWQNNAIVSPITSDTGTLLTFINTLQLQNTDVQERIQTLCEMYSCIIFTDQDLGIPNSYNVLDAKTISLPTTHKQLVTYRYYSILILLALVRVR